MLTGRLYRGAMPLPLSGSQIDKLSVRLRESVEVDEGDLGQLQQLLLAHADVLDRVAGQLREIDLVPTTRLKTSGTIIDKLRRESPITLRSIRDLAGARVVQPMTLAEQDRVTARIAALWPATKVFDRRETPSFGYRAVHIIPKVDGCYVEIQLRTLFQDTWAQFMEMLGDQWGRTIRYGGLPDNPDEPAGSTTRRELVTLWLQMSPHIAKLEEREDFRARMEGTFSDEEREVLDVEIDEGFGELRDLLRELRHDLYDLLDGP